MYAAFFGLQQEAFSIAPDPRFLYLSERHREALAHLLYGARGGGGLVLLTGAVGAGKTTVCRCFIEQLPPDVDLAYVFNPALSVAELLASVGDEFGIAQPAGASLKTQVDALNRFLLARHAQGRSCVLVIDEAQNLGADVLEQLRLLTNLETDTRKLLQIVLIGQPELRERLALQSMQQLAQRVIARYHLEPLSEADTPQYVRHRLAVAGLTGALPFSDAALRRVHRLAGGVPRRINLLCDRALLGAYAQQRSTVTPAMLTQAAREVFGEAPAPQAWRAAAAVAVVAAVAALGAVLWWQWQAPPAAALAMATAAAAASAAAPVAGPAAVAASAEASPMQVPRVDAAALVARRGWPHADAAWRALAPQWLAGAAPAAGAEVCAVLAAQDLACFEGRGTLALLRLLDRPLWLALQLAPGSPAPVLLVALGEREAVLRLPEGELRVSLATLAARWTGDFGTLWRLPPGLAGGARLQPGTPGFAWVQARLREEQAGALPASSAPVLRIQAFQRSQALEVDGLAGPLTLMQLNRAAAVAEPRLQPLADDARAARPAAG